MQTKGKNMRRNSNRAIALAAAVTAILALGPATVPTSPQTAKAYPYQPIGDCTPGSNWGTLRQDLASQVVQLVNQHRASMGLTQLQTTTPLTNAAVWKSRHMAFYRYMAHNDPAPPVARGVGDRLLVCGYPANSAGWGENIAYGYGSAASVMQGWLNSPGHRQNIENPSHRAIGVAAAAASNGTLYWTQHRSLRRLLLRHRRPRLRRRHRARPARTASTTTSTAGWTTRRIRAA
jgi:uncharacterized protein YkwD